MTCTFLAPASAIKSKQSFRESGAIIIHPTCQKHLGATYLMSCHEGWWNENIKFDLKNIIEHKPGPIQSNMPKTWFSEFFITSAVYISDELL